MKTIKFNLQIVGISLLFVSIILKVLDLPFNSLLLTISILLISIEYCIPEFSETLKNVLKNYLLSMFLLSQIFWINPWPGAYLMKGLGVLMLGIYFLMNWFIKIVSKESMNRFTWRNIFNFNLSIFLFFLSLFFHLMNWIGGKSILVEASLIGIYAFIMYLIDFKKNLKFNNISIELNLRFISFVLIASLDFYFVCMN